MEKIDNSSLLTYLSKCREGDCFIRLSRKVRNPQKITECLQKYIVGSAYFGSPWQTLPKRLALDIFEFNSFVKNNPIVFNNHIFGLQHRIDNITTKHNTALQELDKEEKSYIFDEDSEDEEKEAKKRKAEIAKKIDIYQKELARLKTELKNLIKNNSDKFKTADEIIGGEGDDAVFNTI